MKINFETIKAGIKAVPSKTLKGVNSVGASTINAAGSAKQFVSAHTRQAVKNIEAPEFIKKAARFVKEHTSEAVKNVKKPEFLTNALNYVKAHKETFAGSAVIVAAVACATLIAKAVADKIAQAKPEGKHLKGTMHYHQG